MNKYQKWYDELIITRKNMNRHLEYKESHHIIPKSMGGKDVPENIVNLSPREHFIAHALLYKAQPCKKTACALHFMLINSGKNIKRYAPKSSKIYEFAKNEKYKFIKGKPLPKTKVCEHCTAKVTNSSYKKYHGGKCSYHSNQETATKNKLERKRPDKIGQPWPISNAICPWCNKIGKLGNMKQWHFDRCKMNPNLNLQEELLRRKMVTEKSRHLAASSAATRSQIEMKCVWCNTTGKGAAMKTWHFDNCKFNPSGPNARPIKKPLSNDHKMKIKAGLLASGKKIGAPRKRQT